ncbi:ATP-binding protein [Cribrihabitans pelagius]|uniref:ATP-binding protein n=1 Tax=Cribrihabitans pelagius TaxID=1765746 RepID=UPI003B5A7F41
MVQHLPPDFWETLAAEDADPFACDESGRNIPDTHIPARHLLLALRLAAGFGNPEAVEAQLQHGAVTILRGIAPADYEILGRVLTQAILPEGWSNTDPRRMVRQQNRVALVQPRAHGAEPAPRHLEELQDLVSAGLMLGQPLWVVLPNEADLPEPLLAEYCTELCLPAPETDLLTAFLRASHSRTGRIDEAATRAALPPAQHLRELPATTLAFALRAPTAVQVAQRLAQSLAAPEAAPTKRAQEEPAEITGIGPAYDTARCLVADLRLWSEGGTAWNEIPHSLLLHGVPGTGKSHLARAMGRSAQVNCVETSCAEWQSAGHLGNLLHAMRKSFDEALRQVPCILFLDEIDAIGSRSSGDRHGASYRQQVIAGLLEQMDRISREEGVVVVGACNYPERIDSAVLRAGRFDI